jgi:rhodanese-related sulfurtransferase
MLIAALLPAVVSAVLHPRRPSWDGPPAKAGEVTIETVRAWKQPVLWVDARTQAEFLREHVPGATRLNLQEWDPLFRAFLDAWQPGFTVLVYCDSPSCGLSHEVAERLRANGIEPVYVLQGGWQAWKQEQ